MKYDIYVITKVEGITDYSKAESFTELEKAEKRLEKVRAKHKKAQIVLTHIPNYGVGYTIYSKGRYYGTIVSETDNFWIIENKEKDKTGNDLLDEDYFLKDNFDLRFVKDEFDSVEGE